MDFWSPEGKIPRTATLIGIGLAICGNVVISLALNCQKLAHKRLQSHSTALQDIESRSHVVRTPHTPERPRQPTTPLRTRVHFPHLESPSRTTRSRMPPSLTIPEDLQVSAPPQPAPQENGNSDSSEKASDFSYLKSKLWWLGFLLLNVGELGNFVSYAFAPASVVAPLGTVALIANCIFAPLLLKEKFHKRDLFGMFLAICGAVTVVISSKSSGVRLDKDGLIKAITQTTFIVYTAINVVVAAVLAYWSQLPAADNSIFVDVGLCAIFGGFTVLSTKGVSTLLSLEWIEVFKMWITYPILIVLLGTGLGQITYLNRALMRFDSKTVIPTQFVLFNLAAITGSAVLYRDFESISAHQFIDFLYGCITTFLGVFFLTRPNFPKLSIFEPETPLTTPDAPSSVASSPTAATPLLPKVNSNATTPIASRTRKSSSAGLVLSPAAQYLLLSSSPTRGGRGLRGSSSEWAERDLGSIGRRAGANHSASES